MRNVKIFKHDQILKVFKLCDSIVTQIKSDQIYKCRQPVDFINHILMQIQRPQLNQVLDPRYLS